jgi:hypothetical protein
VESIPFTETRDYVQIVLRNSEVYRMIYGQSGAPSSSAVVQTDKLSTGKLRAARLH